MTRLRTIPAWLAATLLYAASAVAMTWPVARAPWRMLYGDIGDGTGVVVLIRNRRALDVGPLSSAVNHLENAPFGVPLSGASSLPQIVVEWPLQLLVGLTAGNEVLAYNIVLFVGLVASPLAAFVLARHVTGGFWAPALAGFVFGFLPWHMAKATGHLVFVHLEAFPVLLLGLLLVREGRRRRGWILVATALLVAAYTSTYFTLVIAAVGVAFVAADLGTALLARSGVRDVVLRAAVLLGIAVTVHLPQALWLIARRSTIDAELSASRGSVDLVFYSARWWEWFVPHSQHLLVGGWTRPFLERHIHGSNFGESSLYLGLVALGLAGVAVVTAIRRRPGTPGFVVVLGVTLMVVGAIVASPPEITPFGVHIPMPATPIHDLFPHWRVYARLLVVVALGLTPLVAIGAKAVLPGTPRAAAAVALALGAAMWVDYAPSHPVLDTRTPPVYTYLSTLGPGSRVEYPLPTAYSVEQAAYTFRTEAAGRPLLTGALPFSWGDTLHRRLVDPGRPWVAPILAELGVRWIVVHGDAYARAGVTPPVPRGASLVKRFGGDSLWKVDVRTPPVGTYPGPEFAGLEPGNGAPSYQWLFGDHGRFVVWNNRERDVPVIVRMEVISFAIDRHVTVRAGDRVLTRVVVPASPSRITFRYTAPPGMSELGVESHEPAQRVGDVLGNGDARVVSFQVGAITTTSATPDGSPDRRNPVLTVR